jgi:hypothetical protein
VCRTANDSLSSYQRLIAAVLVLWLMRFREPMSLLRCFHVVTLSTADVSVLLCSIQTARCIKQLASVYAPPRARLRVNALEASKQCHVDNTAAFNSSRSLMYLKLQDSLCVDCYVIRCALLHTVITRVECIWLICGTYGYCNIPACGST